MKLFLTIASINLFIISITITVNCLNIAINNRPIIGVLSQDYEDGHHSFISSTYVKYLESAGARVARI